MDETKHHLRRARIVAEDPEELRDVGLVQVVDLLEGCVECHDLGLVPQGCVLAECREGLRTDHKCLPKNDGHLALFSRMTFCGP
jgi:hypothetical protein